MASPQLKPISDQNTSQVVADGAALNGLDEVVATVEMTGDSPVADLQRQISEAFAGRRSAIRALGVSAEVLVAFASAAIIGGVLLYAAG